MKEITVLNVAAATIYVPVPGRGTVAGLDVVFNTATVQPNDTVDIKRGSDSVCLLTAVTSIAGEVEAGVQDATNKGLIFDRDSATVAHRVFTVVTTGAPGSATVTIKFDDSAFVEQASVES